MKNIAEILKNAPEGLKLYSLVYGDVKFERVRNDDYPIVTSCGESCDIPTFTKYGKIHKDYENAECVLFPSKEHKSWDEWQDVLFQRGDVIVSIDKVPVLYYEDKGSEYSVYNKYGVKLGKTLTYLFNSRYATPEERDQFMTELNANGYKWNADTKVLAEIKCPNSEHNTNIDNQLKNNTFYYSEQETEVEVTPNGCYKCVLKTEKKNPKFRIGDHIVGDDETIYKIMDVHGTLYTLYDYSNQNKFKQTIKKIDENYSLVTDKELIDAGIPQPMKVDTNKPKPEDYYFTTNGEFFNWIYDRLVNVHGENPNVDYMLSFKERIKKLFLLEKEETDNTSKPTEEKQFTIGDFKPFDRVLVKYQTGSKWGIELFERYDNDLIDYPYICLRSVGKYCIPYNDETKHLLGTTDDYKGKYKTWED